LPDYIDRDLHRRNRGGAAPAGGPLRETNWQRSVSWREAKATIGRPELRVHDLRHTAASVWLASGADPKVVQRVLGHATAAMTMDLYGHMIDRNLWDAAQRLRGTTGARPDGGPDDEDGALAESHRWLGITPWSRLGESKPRPTHYESQACRPSSACPTWPGRRMCGGVHNRPVRRLLAWLLTLSTWEAGGATVSWCPQPPGRVPACVAAQREAEIYGSAAARKAAFDEAEPSSSACVSTRRVRAAPLPRREPQRLRRGSSRS
jgi:Phage integrase family